MVASSPGSPDWWLSRLYRRLRDRQPLIREWDAWYTGNHPAPQGYEKADAMLARILETIGLNMLPVVTDAALDRMEIQGFSVGGKNNDDVWSIWQDNNLDLGSVQVRQEKMALSEACVLVDPNGGNPIVTPEHPEQCVVEYEPGSRRIRAAGLKVWLDELGAEGPAVRAMLYLPDAVYSYTAPTRVYVTSYINPDGSPQYRSTLALQPQWELQPDGSGKNPLGETPLVPFPNGGRMLNRPQPEWWAALIPQKRINKTLLDRMAMQDQGAFKAMWATGLKIPRDPKTGEPVEDFIKAIDRMFVNENPNGKFGQLEAEDIAQLLAAVRDDIADCGMVVPTSPDQIMSKLVNVAADGLKLAQVSEVKRVRGHIKQESEPWEDVARLMLKAAGKSTPDQGRLATQWRNPEYRTDTEAANAATVAIGAGMPRKVAFMRYFNATPDEANDWIAQGQAEDVVTQALVNGVNGGNLNPAPAGVGSP